MMLLINESLFLLVISLNEILETLQNKIEEYIRKFKYIYFIK